MSSLKLHLKSSIVPLNKGLEGKMESGNFVRPYCNIPSYVANPLLSQTKSFSMTKLELEKVRNFNESKFYQVWLHISFNKNFNSAEKNKCGCKSKI
jgi:hypothetical protein